MLPTERHIEGRDHTATVLNWWLRRCGFTHAMTTALAAWVCGDHTWLQGSQLSHLRNNRMRTPQLKLFEGISAVNEAVATWRQQGKEACIRQWGPMPGETPASECMDVAIYLWHPEGGEETPLVFHDFCDLFTGRLRLPYVEDDCVSPGQSKLISDRIGECLDRWMTERGGIRANMPVLLSFYPAKDHQRIARLQQVILNADSYTAVELDEEMLALSELFCQLFGMPSDGKSLYARLLNGEL
jgi:hypothetical protein